jgi:hypothetical protein
MALYLAKQIMEGKMDYVAVFSRKTFQPYKEDVDDILTAEGKQDLIQPIPEV